MVKKYRVSLTEEDQEELKALVSKGRAAAYKQTHARILLLSDENQGEGPMMDREISRALVSADEDLSENADGDLNRRVPVLALAGFLAGLYTEPCASQQKQLTLDP